MKNTNKPTANKLTVRFDKQLMNILINDLKAIKAKNQFLNTQLNAA